MVRQEITGITREGDFPGLISAAEWDLEKHHDFVAGDNHNVGNIQAGFRDHRDIVIHIEVEEAVNGGFGGDHVGIECEWAQDFDELLHILVFAGHGDRDGEAPLLRLARAAWMRNGVGHFRGSEPVDILARAVAKAHFELHGVEVNSDGVWRLVADENFDRKDADCERIGLAEFFFRAGGVDVGVGDD